MLIGFADVESTGVKVETDRICEIALIVQELDTGAERFRYERKINPTVNIPGKTTAIHGIGNADVIGCPTFLSLAPLLAAMLGKLDFIVGHNFRDFDDKIILHEFARAGVPLLKSPIVIDTMLDGRWATPDGKMPTLGELCWSLDIPYDKSLAHRAMYDVEMNTAAWRRGIQIGAFNNPNKET